jgi:hypothetical protein
MNFDAATSLRLIDHHGIPHGGNVYIEHLWPPSDIKKMREQLRREERRRAAVTALEVQSAAIKTAVTSLSWLIVPAPRKAVHSTALAALIQQRDALDDLLSQARRPDLTLREAETAHLVYTEALGEVTELWARIRAIRVGHAPRGA